MEYELKASLAPAHARDMNAILEEMTAVRRHRNKHPKAPSEAQVRARIEGEAEALLEVAREAGLSDKAARTAAASALGRTLTPDQLKAELAATSRDAHAAVFAKRNRPAARNFRGQAVAADRETLLEAARRHDLHGLEAEILVDQAVLLGIDDPDVFELWLIERGK